MSLATPSLAPDDLLTHAERLVQPSIAATDVTDIDLRRSVSACYYALFHAITSRLAGHLLPDTNGIGRAHLVRSIDHHAVRRVSHWIARNSTPPAHVAAHVADLRGERSLVAVSDAFLELMDSRHRADYDRLAVHDEALARNVLASSRNAVDALGNLDDRSEAAAVWRALICLAARVR